MFGVEFYCSEGCNVIVVVGGGSLMDCVKGIGIVVVYGCSIFEFEGVDWLWVLSLLLILILIIVGILVDVLQFVIIFNQDECMKFFVVSKVVVFDVLLIDLEIMLIMDFFFFVCIGIDVLVYVIEVFVFIGYGLLIDFYVLEVMCLIDGNLVQMIVNFGDIVLCEKIMFGSMQVGLVFFNVIFGVVYVMLYSFGGYFDLFYGLCNVVLVEYVVVFNYSVVLECFKVIVEIFGIDCCGLIQGQVCQCLVDYLIVFKYVVGFYESFVLYGVGSFDIFFFLCYVMQDLCIFINLCELSQCDVEVVYGEVF